MSPVFSTLNELSAHARVFIDANIFIYHMTGTSKEATDFFRRCESDDLTGITSCYVITEVLHRLMMVEAISKGLVKPPQAVAQLERRPEMVKHLSDYSKCLTFAGSVGVEVLPLEWTVVQASQAFRDRYGLLTADSLTAAHMAQHDLVMIATMDEAFSRLPHLKVFRPSDLSTPPTAS